MEREHMQKNIVTIGGGTGTSVINEALIIAGASGIKSIVTVMDSGGITGRMRTDSKGEEIAYSDALRTLLSLIDPKKKELQQVKSLYKILRKRNERGQDLGYTIFSYLYSKERGFSDIQETLESLTGLTFNGEVIPITTHSTNLVFRTVSGRVYRGEHELDDKRMSKDQVQLLWLDPEVAAFPAALEAIKQADIIVFSCGSLHGSILVNFLPKGVIEAYAASHAVKILVTNLVSARNETHHFKPDDFIKIFSKYAQLKKPLDLLIVPKLSEAKFNKKYKSIADMYDAEHAHFLGWEDGELKHLKILGVDVLKHDGIIVDSVYHRLRHDPQKLAQVFKKLFRSGP